MNDDDMLSSLFNRNGNEYVELSVTNSILFCFKQDEILKCYRK
jgi:hypothetical protein